MKNKINPKVIIYSIIGLACVGLMFFISWWFIIGAGIMIWLNQRELYKKTKTL